MKFNNIRLRNKFLILYIFAVFLPIMLTNIIFYMITTESVKDQKTHDIDLILKQIKTDFLESVDDAIGISTSLYTDNLMNEFFERSYDTPLEYIESYDRTLRGFNKYGPSFSSIQKIEFYTNNPTVLYSGGVRYLGEEEWEGTDKEKNDSLPIIKRTTKANGESNLSVIRKLNFFKTYNEYAKVVKVDIDNLVLDSIFQNVTFEGDIFLINNKGIVEYAKNKELEWENQDISFRGIDIPENAQMFQETIHHNSGLKDWQIVGVIAEQEILEEVYQSRRFLYYVAFFNLIIPTVIIIIISNTFYSRLMKIVTHIKKVKNQQFQVIKGPEDQDEIGTLIKEYNRMIIKIKELINDVYKVNIQKKNLQLQKKQAQLSALQSQIDPHFLFNALETIRMRSIIKKEEETARIIHNMAKMLRNSITWGKDWVVVEDEVNIIIAFLEIQKYRFGSKLTYRIKIDPQIKQNIIPNMSILPFVENASIHGIEPRKSEGEICLDINKIDSTIEVIVKDNGPGFNSDKLTSLLESLTTQEQIGEHVGIKNVYYRLKLYYGNNFDFSIESQTGAGTRIKLVFPVQNEGLKGINR